MIRRTLLAAMLVLGVTSLLRSAKVSAQCVPVPPGIVSWWRAEGNALDSVGGHHGTTMGPVTYVPGRVGSAFQFDGTSTWIEVPDSPSFTLGSNPFSIELWAQFAQLRGFYVFVGHDDGPGEEKKWLFWCGNGGFSFHVNSPPSCPVSEGIGVVDDWFPVTDRWYHLAVTRSGSTYVLYIDGVQELTRTDTGSNVIPDSSAPLTIGWAEENFFFDGIIDEVTLYNRALTAEEIAAIASAGVWGKCDEVPEILQIPGDSNQDGGVDLSDGVAFLQWFFLGVPLPTAAGSELCLTDPVSATAVGLQIMDWTGEGVLDLSDGIGLLTWFFGGGAEHDLGPDCILTQSPDCISTCVDSP